MSNTTTFSQKLKRLEEIVSTLEQPDLELEEGLKLLEEGIVLHKESQKILTQSQAKIDTLLQDSDTPEQESTDTSSLTITESVQIELNDQQDELPF